MAFFAQVPAPGWITPAPPRRTTVYRSRPKSPFPGSGTHVDFDPVFAWPKPVQKPHPPIYVGGEGERSIARVAEYGGGWLPRAVAENLTELVPQVRDRAGWRVPVSVYGAPRDPALVESYAAAGIDRTLFLLPDLGRDEALRALDELAELAAGLR